MSVGHVSRAIEESGIPTVTVMVRAFEYRAREMKIPRTLTVRHPMGRVLGAAGDKARHHEVLNAAFDMLNSATSSGTIVEFPEDYRPTPVV